MDGGFRHEQAVQERESRVGKNWGGSQEKSVTQHCTRVLLGKIVMRREGVDTKYAGWRRT